MPGCSAKRCGRNSSKKEQFHENGIDKVSFHQFPANQERKAEWIKRVREAGKGSQWNPSHNAKLCSLHFEESYIDRTCTEKNKPLTILSEDAIPTIFPNVKPKTQKKTKNTNTVENTILEHIRHSPISELFNEEPRPEMSSQGEKKMVTIPSNEGYRVILPNISDHSSEQHVNIEQIPQSPQPDETMNALIGAPTAKLVTLGAQPFNDDEHDAAEPVLEDLCGGYDGPSCSSGEECCVSFSPSDVCVSIAADEKIVGTPANKLRQAIELLQSFQVDMFNELPAEQLSVFESLMKNIYSEGSDLLRNLAIKQDQISALKRYGNSACESEEEKRLRSEEMLDIDDIDGLQALEIPCEPVDTPNSKSVYHDEKSPDLEPIGTTNPFNETAENLDDDIFKDFEMPKKETAEQEKEIIKQSLLLNLSQLQSFLNDASIPEEEYKKFIDSKVADIHLDAELLFFLINFNGK